MVLWNGRGISLGEEAIEIKEPEQSTRGEKKEQEQEDRRKKDNCLLMVRDESGLGVRRMAIVI